MGKNKASIRSQMYSADMSNAYIGLALPTRPRPVARISLIDPAIFVMPLKLAGHLQNELNTMFKTIQVPLNALPGEVPTVLYRYGVCSCFEFYEDKTYGYSSFYIRGIPQAFDSLPSAERVIEIAQAALPSYLEAVELQNQWYIDNDMPWLIDFVPNKTK